MTGFEMPPGDVAGLQAAAASLGRVATDLTTQVGNARAAIRTALTDWRATRADDFEHAGQALVDELALASLVAGRTATLVSAYATELQNTMNAIRTYQSAHDNVQDPTGPVPDPDEITAAARARSNWIQQAVNARTDLTTYARQTARAVSAQTDLAVPKGDKLSAAEIARQVDAAFGITSMNRSQLVGGTASNDQAWAVLLTGDGPVFDTDAPVPGDPDFQAWYAALTPVQQLLETQKLQTTFSTKGFNPYGTVQGGPLPAWAQTFNDTQAPYCTADGSLAPGYGYFGGGTILGPGGKQWPIVMPYYSDGKHVYMADSGATRTDGGIDQLDGKDPGWQTVTTYSGLGQFGSVSGSTKFWTGILVATGQELETTSTDPGAVAVDANGVPYAGNDVHELPSGPPDKAWWDVESDSMMPKPMENLPPGSIQPNLEYNEPALGANALLVQAGQAASAINNESSHAQRQWYVDYQVNDDGRVRAVVHTYSATATEDDKTLVGSFANTFPTGQSGTTNEIPYNTRFTDYKTPVMYPAPDPDVEYTGRGDPQDNAVPIPEKLNK